MIVDADIDSDTLNFLPRDLLVVCVLGDIDLDVDDRLIPWGYGVVIADKDLPYYSAVLTGLVLFNTDQLKGFTHSLDLCEEPLALLLKVFTI